MILVTGSSGHLGEALMRVLKDASADVQGVDLKAGPFTQRLGSLVERKFVRDCMRGLEAVIHTATLHKPHIETHSRQEFVDANVTGTLNLLEEALAARVQAFVYTSTTSAFGEALTPVAGEPAAWITEEVMPIPKNIYGVTKVAAENLCELFARRWRLPSIVLRTSRFFPEEDDDPQTRERFSTENMQANEMLYRRVDIEDAASAHLLALKRARSIGFGRYIISATTPFERGHAVELKQNAPAVVRRLFPDAQALFDERGWHMLPVIDRIYVNSRARSELQWQPKYDFRHVLDSLRGRDARSGLATDVGSKGYHANT